MNQMSLFGRYCITFFLFLSLSITVAYSQSGVDHHLHIRSESGSEALIRILEEVRNQEGIQLEESIGAEEVLRLMDSTGTEKAVLLSVAYMFAMPDVDFENEEAGVREENRFTARQMEYAPDRLKAFCSVNPLSDYALDEIRWCGNDGRFTGLKLHFANSSIDLRNTSHLERLEAVFQLAEELNLAVIVHVWTRNPDYGERDAKIFIENILQKTNSVPVQIAHLGGPGTFSDVTDTVAKTFVREFEESDQKYNNVYFDIAEVPVRMSNNDTQEITNEKRMLNRRMEQRIRELGVDRILWGTDYIAGPATVYNEKIESVSLPNDLMKEIIENPSPYFE
jgi:uncharacterized protein